MAITSSFCHTYGQKLYLPLTNKRHQDIVRKRTFKLCFWMKGKTNIFILINCVKLFSRALGAFLKSKLSASNNLNICIHDDLLQVFMQANLAFQMLWNAATIGGGNVKTRNMCRGRRNIQMWQGQNFQEKKHSK